MPLRSNHGRILLTDSGFLSSGSEATNNNPFPMARTHRHLSVGTVEVALFVNAF